MTAASIISNHEKRYLRLGIEAITPSPSERFFRIRLSFRASVAPDRNRGRETRFSDPQLDFWGRFRAAVG